MRIAFVQHGDYRETVHRFDQGLGETYYAQRLSVDAVAELRELADEVCVICVTADRYDETLSNGVRAIGLPVRQTGCYDELSETVRALGTTHMIPRTPMISLFDTGRRYGMRMLAMLADSFRQGLRGRIRYHKLARRLNHSSVEWVGNHNMNAALSLRGIGVRATKVIPWDWPPQHRPEEMEPRQLDTDDRVHRILFVGSQTEPKGLGDAIRAVASLASTDLNVELLSVGAGETEGFAEFARQCGIADRVKFFGRVEHSRVCQLMREVDCVVVPSRHEYPEGLPFTIYDALASRTPLIVSNHNMFRGKVQHGVSGLVFPAGDFDALADQIKVLLGDTALYARISDESPAAFRRIECPAKWHDIVRRWILDREEDRQWIRSHTLAESLPATA